VSTDITSESDVPLGDTADFVGRIVDDLAIVELLGVGASGAVYKAIEKGPNSRMVALKMLNPAEQKLRQKLTGNANPFERDLQVAKVVDNPSVARAYRTGQSIEGRFYLVMELVEGQPLADELHYRGKLPWKEAVSLMIDVGRAVGSFHAVNIIHRDIAPGNIMVKTHSDGRRRVKLIDFGIAMLGHESDKEGTLLFDIALGTPQYMAPEQALGRGSSRRSDVFSLGAVFYHMLAGTSVLSLKRSTAHACIEYLKSGNAIPSIPLSSLVAEDVPPSLVRLIENSLAVDPERRPADANAFVEECKRFSTVESRSAPKSRREKFGDFVGGLFRKKKVQGSRFARRD
jgi:eukaryotic-like serine/threonine-protein kinase